MQILAFENTDFFKCMKGQCHDTNTVLIATKNGRTSKSY